MLEGEEGKTAPGGSEIGVAAGEMVRGKSRLQHGGGTEQARPKKGSLKREGLAA